MVKRDRKETLLALIVLMLALLTGLNGVRDHSSCGGETTITKADRMPANRRDGS